MNYIEFFLIKIFHKIVYLTKYPKTLNISSNDFYHRFIYTKLSLYLKQALDSINRKNNNISHINKGPIWIFWWQGRNHMPLLVKKCIESVVNHSGNHKVILITKLNIRRYSNIPEYIYKKVEQGKISLTHLSDILRFNLLYNHGGLWIDSTMYCSSDLTKKYFSRLYTSGGYKGINRDHQFISSQWTGFLIGGCKNNLLFAFMNEFFKLYWKNNNYQIDYFLIDYGLLFAYQHNIGDFYTYVNKVACNNNPKLYKLVYHLNDRYNPKLYKKITENTQLFKLTYKQKFNLKSDTFYRRLINNKL